MRINVFNPYAEQIAERGIIETLNNTQAYFAPFLQLLGARWLSAVQSDEQRNSRSIGNLADADCDTIVMHDWYVTEISEHKDRLDIARSFSGKIFVVSDLPVVERRLPGNVYNIAKNYHQLDLDACWDDTEPNIRYALYKDPPGRRTPAAPMGCAEAWLPKSQHYRPVIFFDEPHVSVIRSLSSDNSVISAHYLHGLAVARILIERGFALRTFCRDGWTHIADLNKKYDGFEIIDGSGWVPFASIVKHYATASMFFSFTGETFGYSTFENLQLGNGIIAYSEHRNAYDFQQMQNSALISIHFSPKLCADIICEFFNRFEKRQLRPIISNEANLLYSTETFMPRLRTAINSILA